jgi:lipopolysaccharide/colanic/teichoic acid biosynthesis glycosyltransferase
MPNWKRTLDIAASLAVMPILAVCTLLMTIMLRLCSPGPVFFTQERIGYKGRRFRIYKFRTMTVGADCSAHRAHYSDLMRSNAPMVKLDSGGDQRLIPGGWLLRASGLDELPQLLNVLNGDMSLVGPRPCMPYEYENYSPWQKERFNSTPGLTGLWQVSGKNRTTFEQMIRLDHEYSENLTFWLDAKIILLTVPALVMQIGDVRTARAKRPRAGGALAIFRPEPQSKPMHSTDAIS